MMYDDGQTATSDACSEDRFFLFFSFLADKWVDAMKWMASRPSASEAEWGKQAGAHQGKCS